jgi:hypothetical protein
VSLAAYELGKRIVVVGESLLSPGYVDVFVGGASRFDRSVRFCAGSSSNARRR